MRPSPSPLLVEFLDPRPGLRKSLSCPDILIIKTASVFPRFRFSRFRRYLLPSAWLLPPPASFSATGKTRFNTQ